MPIFIPRLRVSTGPPPRAKKNIATKCPLGVIAGDPEIMSGSLHLSFHCCCDFLPVFVDNKKKRREETIILHTLRDM